MVKQGAIVEKSPHYNEIVKMIVRDESPIRISEYLLEEYGEEIGKDSIYKYAQRLKQEIHERKELIEDEIRLRKADEFIEQNIEEYGKVRLNVEDSINKKAASLVHLEKVGRIGIDALNHINYDELTNRERIELAKVGVNCMKYVNDFNQKKINVSVERDLSTLFDKRELLNDIAGGEYNGRN